MKAFLIVVLLTAGNGYLRSSTEVPTMQECIEMLAYVKFSMAQPSEDNEGVGVAFCSYEDHTGWIWE